MPIVIALDPSFTRTGYVIRESADNYKVGSLDHHGSNETNLTLAMTNALSVAKDVKALIDEVLEERGKEEILVVVEYPIMATTSGGYLAFITTKLDSLFRSYKLPCVIYLPAIAHRAFTKAKTKTEIVKFVKENKFCPNFKGNHDEATAVILAEIGLLAHTKKYKKSFYFMDYSAN